MRREVWVAGFPGYWGGADTELDHLIDLFVNQDVAVHLVPMFAADPVMAQSVEKRGCRIHNYTADVFCNRIVICFCNQNFLAALPAIVNKGKPAKIIWFNCMTWLFEDERRAHAEGWIDYFGFSSEYQKASLTPLLNAIRPFSTFPYRPYFNVQRVPWRYRPWNERYCIGRISRDNASKYAPDTWRIFDRVLVPPTLQKNIYLLGYGPIAARAIGPPPSWLSTKTWQCNEVSTSRFFNSIDTMIHKTGTSRESYCRVLVEAYAHGVVPIVEHAYAFPELVVHGETGYMASDSDEMSFLASLLAHNPHDHQRMAKNGREHLESSLVNARTCWDAWDALL